MVDRINPSSLPEQFGREELWDIRKRAKYFKNIKGTNPSWQKAFERLENAVDILDAFIARSAIREHFPI